MISSVGCSHIAHYWLFNGVPCSLLQKPTQINSSRNPVPTCWINYERLPPWYTVFWVVLFPVWIPEYYEYLGGFGLYLKGKCLFMCEHRDKLLLLWIFVYWMLLAIWKIGNIKQKSYDCLCSSFIYFYTLPYTLSFTGISYSKQEQGPHRCSVLQHQGTQWHPALFIPLLLGHYLGTLYPEVLLNSRSLRSTVAGNVLHSVL